MAGMDEMRSWVTGLILAVFVAASAGIALNEFQKEIINDQPLVIVNNETLSLLGSDNNPRNATVAKYGVLFNSIVNVTNASMLALAAADFNQTSPGLIQLKVGQCNSTNACFASYQYFRPTHQVNITDNGLLGTSNSTSFLGVSGTLIGVAMLISIALGAFAFARK